jgi:hypothetical protein
MTNFQTFKIYQFVTYYLVEMSELPLYCLYLLVEMTIFPTLEMFQLSYLY